jgi:hypothetical protein
MQKNLHKIGDEIIASGIACIAEEQNRDGSFPSLSGSKKDVFSGARQYTTTFFAANILSALNGLHDARTNPIREKAFHFLLSQKSAIWSFNYWARNAKEYTTMPYPDDLDDTFVALAALQGYDPGIVQGAALAEVAKMLTVIEAEKGGPYQTWLIADDAPQKWHDVDIAVNANIAYFLSDFFDVAVPNLAALIDKRIQEGDLCSPYYPGIVQVIYFISRMYRGNQKSTLVDLLMAKRDKNGLWGNSLVSAMAISALVNLGAAEMVSDADTAAFLNGVCREGWVPWAFCIDPSRKGKTHYAGSSALTAAFCIQALRQLAGASAPGLSDNKKKISPHEGDDIFLKITSLARGRMFGTPRNLKELARRKIDHIKDKEIVMVPYMVRDALGKRCVLSPRILNELALANLYGWIAYTIYDDFLDAEGDLPSLSAANFFLRELTTLYAALDEQIPKLGTCFKKLMDQIDDANLWEQQYCRAEVAQGILILPRRLPYVSVTNLADRSLGHALPAIALFLSLGYAPNAMEITTTLSFFKNYLIARQLHDDAHDWKEDLLRGQINSAGAKLLREWRKREGSDNRRIDLAESLPELQRFFWRVVIDEVVRDIHWFVDRAREDLQKLNDLENPHAMALLLDRLSASAQRTLRERETAIDFLSHY